MRKTLLAFFIIFVAASPSLARADASSTPQDQTPPAPAPVTIHANVNIRYQGSLVWTGSVALAKGSTASVADDSGATRSIASDSALEALEAADALSPDFSVSDLKYYADYDAYYIKCIDIAAAPAHACDNWQYVVDSAYPPVGVDKYTVQDGDTLYFYFGNPRRVTLGSPNGIISSPVAAKAETYDYTNNTWTALAGAEVGATQQNPSDPYSPLVAATAVSGADGIAELVIDKPGSYGVGLAQDYYSSVDALTVVAPQAGGTAIAAASTASAPAVNPPVVVHTGPVQGTLVATSSEPMSVFVPTAPPETTPAGSVLGASTEKDPVIALDMPLDSFLKRYAAALAEESAASTFTR